MVGATKGKPGHKVGPLVVLFGGFCDSIFEPAKSAMKHLKSYFGACTDMFFSWDEEDEALEAIGRYRKRSALGITLVGHSYGGESAMSVAARLGDVEVRRVVTLDPTTHFKTERSDNIAEWINIYVIGINDASDFISWIGGNWGFQQDADVNVAVTASAGEKSDVEAKKRSDEVVVVAPRVTHASVIGMLNILKHRGYLPMKP
jgi:pimeloyl-ACP methyl ester carboxylesterase